MLRTGCMLIAVMYSLSTSDRILSSYVVISSANDCLHSGAFGMPQNQATPCTDTEVNAYIDRVITVANDAQAFGLTPIFTLYPPYAALDLPLLQQIAGFVFVANEQQYNTLAMTWARRLAAEVPGAIVVDALEHFEHLGDGIHPTPETSLIHAPATFSPFFSCSRATRAPCAALTGSSTDCDVTSAAARIGS